MTYGVEFESEKEQNESVLYARIKHTNKQVPKMVRKLQEWGIADSNKQATHILFGASLIAIFISIILFIVAGTVPEPTSGTLPPGQVVPT